MAVREALEARLEELRGIEECRKEAKEEAFRSAFQADSASLDLLGAYEVVVLDRQYVVVEVHSRKELSKAANATGPGQHGYSPGTRLLLGVYLRNGSPRIKALSVQDLDEMAQLALTMGQEFEDLTSSIDAVLGIDDSIFWHNLVN